MYIYIYLYMYPFIYIYILCSIHIISIYKLSNIGLAVLCLVNHQAAGFWMDFRTGYPQSSSICSEDYPLRTVINHPFKYIFFFKYKPS